MPEQARKLADFEGVWRISRQIDHADGTRAHFDGEGVFTPVPEGLAFRETGLLRIGTAAPLEAQQHYHWDAELNVYFPDGRLFHTVPPMGGQVQHFCDPDTYAGAYDFGDWPVFLVTWEVSGPRKSYRMASRFAR